MQERKMVDQLLAALENAPSLSTAVQAQTSKSALPLASINLVTSDKDYEAFLKSVKRCASLAEARRLRSDILLALRRADLSAESKSNLETETTPLSTYQQRLLTAKTLIEERIEQLGGALKSKERTVSCQGHKSN
jgi:sorting nexin-25